MTADNLTIDRGDRRVFTGLSFSVGSGASLQVTGANGIGKSSLLRTIAGLVSLTEGELTVEDGDPELTVGEHCHYFGHQNSNKPALTALENLSFWRDFTAPMSKTVFDGSAQAPLAALEMLGIGHTASIPAAYLSAGQGRRLALARLIVTPRPIWLMDEPTSALDTTSEAHLLYLMNLHLKRGGMIITATHTELALSKKQKLHLQAAELA
ncbi:heme ABC exporter ATP-binding protein CcmA [Roseibium hamelinense]|uniref:heme ABC exporter ATP-binding protein CcmA n=1 Tax=Roseibium hamelinense TaxID=150831 RepID=UPI003137B60C